MENMDGSKNIVVRGKKMPALKNGKTSVEQCEKISLFAKKELKKKLKNGHITAKELEHLQRKDYSKSKFGIEYPLLCKVETIDAPPIEGYFCDTIEINKEFYFICSMWSEEATNNHRPLLEKWLDAHKKKYK